MKKRLIWTLPGLAFGIAGGFLLGNTLTFTSALPWFRIIAIIGLMALSLFCFRQT